MSSKKVKGFMCRTDFDYELGKALGGSRIHPSLEDLRQHHMCCKPKGQCGIVEVEVRLVRVVRKGKL